MHHITTILLQWLSVPEYKENTRFSWRKGQLVHTLLAIYGEPIVTPELQTLPYFA